MNRIIVAAMVLIAFAIACKKQIDEPLPRLRIEASKTFATRIEVKWENQGEHAKYRVFRTIAPGKDPNAEYTEIGITSDTIFVDRDVISNQSFYYYILVENNPLKVYASAKELGRTIALTAEEAFAELGVGTGGLKYDARGAASVPGIIIKVIQEQTIGTNSDIIFLIDNTASMRDDIDQVRRSLNEIIDALPSGTRLGMATYNDRNVDPSNWFKFQDLSTDYESSRTFLNAISVYGGGDIPESVYDGIYETVSRAKWQSSKRIVIVIGDAPPLEGILSVYTYQQIIAKCVERGVDVNLYPILIK